jgi:hypothetical protein
MRQSTGGLYLVVAGIALSVWLVPGVAAASRAQTVVTGGNHTCAVTRTGGV